MGNKSTFLALTFHNDTFSSRNHSAVKYFMLQVMIPSEYQTGPILCEFPPATPQMATHSQKKMVPVWTQKPSHQAWIYRK